MYDYILTDEHNIGKKSMLNNLNQQSYERLSNSEESNDSKQNKKMGNEEHLNNNRNSIPTRCHVKRGRDLTDNFSEDESLENVKISDDKNSPKVYYGKKFQNTYGHETGKLASTFKKFSVLLLFMVLSRLVHL